MSIPTWIKLRMGHPLKPQKGGLVQNVLKFERRKWRQERELDDGLDVPVSDPKEALHRHAQLDRLESGFLRLDARERFIIETHHELLKDVGFDEAGLRIRCGRMFAKREAIAIVRRSAQLDIDPSSRALELQQIAVLLDLSAP